MAGRPALELVLERIGAQSRHILISANRNLKQYGRYGYRVIPDNIGDFAGPLAGIAAGLATCGTAYLLTLPVDAPLISPDYLARMKRCLEHSDRPACVAACAGRLEPVFCLLARSTLASLDGYLQAGHRSVHGWLASVGAARVDFSDVPEQFINLNRADDQRRLEQRLQP